MPAFHCPECHGMSFAVHRASYYWCDCGQPLTAADAVPGMALGVGDETPSHPLPLRPEDRGVDARSTADTDPSELPEASPNAIGAAADPAS